MNIIFTMADNINIHVSESESESESESDINPSASNIASNIP